MFYLTIHRSQIKAQLAQMLGLELAALEFDHDIAAQLQVVKQQVDEKFVPTHVQQHLPPDKGKARTQLKQEIGNMFDQCVFDFTLLRLVGQPQKVETVGGFERLARQTVAWAGWPRSW